MSEFDLSREDFGKLLSEFGAMTPEELPPEYQQVIGAVLNCDNMKDMQSNTIVLSLKILKEIQIIREALYSHKVMLGDLVKENEKLIAYIEGNEMKIKH